MAVGFMMTHWTERQLLTTDNWVALVGPLPQNNTVATALSGYSVNKLFDGADIQARIQSALPDKAAFLAPVLTEQLHDRTTRTTKKFIQSDRFAAVWTTVNKTAHERLMNRARSPESTQQSRVANVAIKLGALTDKIRSFLGKDNVGPSAESKVVALRVNLNEKVQTFGRYVRLVDFLSATLWLGALAGLLGAFVFARRRRRLLLVLSAVFVVIALLQLIGIRSVRPMVLNLVQDSAYRPAIGVIYDDLVANFRHSATLLFILSAAVFLISYFTQARFFSRSRTVTKQLNVLDNSSWLARGREVRAILGEYRWQIAGGVVVGGLIVLAFLVDTDWQGLIRGALVILIAIELINLAAARAPRSAPM
jgi:hypothetical protein